MRIARIHEVLTVATVVSCLSASATHDGSDEGKQRVKVFRYPTGAAMLQEYYHEEANMPYLSRWYSPSGEQLFRTDWQEGTGLKYSLRDDGTLRFMTQGVGGVVHGPRVEFDESGTKIVRIRMFVQGEKRHVLWEDGNTEKESHKWGFELNGEENETLLNNDEPRTGRPD